MRTMEQLETALAATEDATILTMAEVLENLAELESTRNAPGPSALRAAAKSFQELVENRPKIMAAKAARIAAEEAQFGPTSTVTVERPAEAEDGEKH